MFIVLVADRPLEAHPVVILLLSSSNNTIAPNAPSGTGALG